MNYKIPQYQCKNYKEYTKCKYCDKYGKYIENKLNTKDCYKAKGLEKKLK
jgi:hypothetical protein